MRLSLPSGSKYAVTVNGAAAPLVGTGDWDYPWRVDVNVSGPARVELKRAEK